MYALSARASAIRISSRFPTVPAATLDWRSIARMVAIGTESGPMPAGVRWGPKSGNDNSLEIRELDLIVPTRDREEIAGDRADRIRHHRHPVCFRNRRAAMERALRAPRDPGPSAECGGQGCHGRRVRPW